MPSNPAGQTGSQDDGPSAGSHRTGSGGPLKRPEIQSLVFIGWRRAHWHCFFPKFLRAIPAWASLQIVSFTQTYVPSPPI